MADPNTESEMASPETVVVGGLPTVRLTKDKLADLMVRDCLTARSSEVSPKLVFSSNGQGVSLAGRDRQFFEAMLAADYIHADGQSVVAASRLTSLPLPERIATTDFFHNAARAAEANDLSFYFLGGSQEQVARVVRAVAHQYPRLIIAGSNHGYHNSAGQLEKLREDIRLAAPDVLWVGLGKPLQEYWSVANKFNVGNVGWIKTCGGLFAFLTGDAPRAPTWMQNAGMEWLYRLSREPRRLALRYAATNPHALYRLITKTRQHNVK